MSFLDEGIIISYFHLVFFSVSYFLMGAFTTPRYIKYGFLKHLYKKNQKKKGNLHLIFIVHIVASILLNVLHIIALMFGLSNFLFKFLFYSTYILFLMSSFFMFFISSFEYVCLYVSVSVIFGVTLHHFLLLLRHVDLPAIFLWKSFFMINIVMSVRFILFLCIKMEMSFSTGFLIGNIIQVGFLGSLITGTPEGAGYFTFLFFIVSVLLHKVLGFKYHRVV